MSTEAGGQAVVRAQPVSFLSLPCLLLAWLLADECPAATQFLWFPCGIVRGALAAMGITATVQAETSELPAAIFQIRTVPST